MSGTMIPTNQSRYFFKSAALPSDAWQVTEFTGVEELSSTYKFVVQLVSTDGEIDLDAVIGKPATLSLTRRDGEPVPVHGVVSEFRQGAYTSDYYSYEATLVPHLWLLSLSYQCRVFQNMKVEDIIAEVLGQGGVDSFRFALRSSPPKREYCVQYRETDLNFVQRLLEHEGIYYFFTHDGGGGETVVFTDDRGQSPDIAGDRALEYHAGAGLVATEDMDTVREFTATRQLVTGNVLLKDYNYRTPETRLVAKAKGEGSMPGIFHDYGEHFKTPGEGNALAQVRSQEFDAGRRVFAGETGCPALHAGSVFGLAEHFRADFNADYLLTRVEHEGSQRVAFGNAFNRAVVPTYRARFNAIPASTPYRPPRITPIPRISGIITARVETAGGDYAYIDDQGRYRVKMPFDMNDKKNGLASRPIRMAQPYSGANYGIHFPNRADTEMVLACVDGNVDRPMAISTVPNPSNTAPAVAANKPQCVIRSAGQNELTLDDTIGSENILLHGTKDWTISITNDKNQTVGNNETLAVKVNQGVDIGSNQSIHVGQNRDKTVDANQSEKIGVNKTIDVGSNHTETIGGNMAQTVGGMETETVALFKALSIGAAYQVSVGAVMNETVGGAKIEEIGGAKMVTVAVMSSETVGTNKSVDAGANISEQAGANISSDAGANISSKAGSNISSDAGANISSKAGGDVVTQAGKKVSITAGDDFGVSGGKNGVISIADQLVLKCGSASITMKKNGDIIMKGNKITVDGSSDVVIKGSNVLAN